MGRELRWLDLTLVEAAVAAARKQRVSVVATGPGGFVPAYRRAGGDPDSLGNHRSGEPWRSRRNGFVARHMAQVKGSAEPLWRDGAPTRRHLALAVWAYSPSPARLARWLSDNGFSR